jgi:hypothetical protein
MATMISKQQGNMKELPAVSNKHSAHAMENKNRLKRRFVGVVVGYYHWSPCY